MDNFTVNTETADGIALLCTRNSAGTVVTKVGSLCLYMKDWYYKSQSTPWDKL